MKKGIWYKMFQMHLISKYVILYASLKKWIYGFYPRQMIECLIMMINN